MPDQKQVDKQTENVLLAAGVIVIEDDEILLVREKGRWGLPKGGREQGEFFIETATREALEETGLQLRIGNLAFVSEFKIKGEEQHVQLFFEGTIVGGRLASQDPDGEIQEVKFVPIRQLRSYLTFKPRLLPLEDWLKTRQCHYFSFELQKAEDWFID